MGVFDEIGRLSDQLTGRLLLKHSAPAAADLVKDRRGFVRKAQLSAVMATSQPMMLANICNALALVTLEYYQDRVDVMTMVWAALVTAFATMGIRSARRFRTAPPRKVASVRAPGKITFSAMILSILWCYPLVALLPDGDMLQMAFICALTAGMIAGGALALYPVPLAGFVYVSVMSVMAFFTIVVTGEMPLLPFGLVISSFALIVAFSTKRHTVLFLCELIGRLQAETQRDMVNLLLDTYQGKGGQYLWRSDRHLNLTATPGSLFQMIGVRHVDVSTSNLIELLCACDAVGHNADSVAAYTAMKELSHPAETDFEMILRIRDGRFLKVAGRGETSDETGLFSYHGYLKDVTGELQAIEKMYHLATRDTMTGLLNYREFCAQGKVRLETMRDRGGEVFFVFLDADNLKKVNDSFGHAIGDRLIETIGERFENSLPDQSLVSRKGGDEFVALVVPDGATNAEVWANTLIDTISVSFGCDGLEIPVSCCLGVSRATCAQASLPTLELEADRALYSAKSHGRRQARIYKEKFGQEIQRDRMLAFDLSAAIDNCDLNLVFQPIVDMHDYRILGAEALLRWKHPVYHDVAPEKIVSIAQTEGLGPKLFEYVLFHAISHAGKWRGNCFVSVNMHSSDLQIVNCSARVSEILTRLNFSAGRLWLEVTESELLKDSGTTRENLKALRATGVSIAIDDFGAGYSSLSYLKTYPSDVIKIDRSLIAGCDRNESNRIIIQTMKSLAAVSGFQVVAEGIERESEMAHLRQSGVEMGQGFGFYTPIPPAEMLALLSERCDPMASPVTSIS